jgi:hypothetical protein
MEGDYPAASPTAVSEPHWQRNLRLRPHSPAKGRGRIQRQVRRAFMASDSPAARALHLWPQPGFLQS